jgi:dienelactone hydrolase
MTLGSVFRHGRSVFTAAVALIAAHTLVDAFVAPEPGTRWSDHLVSAGASLAVLAAAVVAYPHLREGGRAAVALALGVLAIEGALLTVSDARRGGPAGEDWTGFLLWPAGIALCALGVALAWRPRKPAGRRYLRRGLIVAAAALAAYWAVIPVAVALLATHRPREAESTPGLGRPAIPVTVRTSDGLDLHGRYVPSRNGAAVLVFPGSPSRAPHARALVRGGYGVLMLDMRGYATSDGDPNMFGWNGTRDIDAGVEFLRARPDVRGDRIGGIGFSVGGELMLEAAAGNAALRAVVADGAGERSVRESALRGAEGWLSLPTYAIQTAAVAVLSGDLPPPSLVDLTPRIAPRPLLLIGAGADNGGEDLQPHYYAAAREPKAFWRIPEAGHTGGFDARPREYARRVLGFFDAALAPAPVQ